MAQLVGMAVRLRRQQRRQQQVFQLGAKRVAGQHAIAVDGSHGEVEQRPPFPAGRTAEIKSRLKFKCGPLPAAKPIGQSRLDRLARYLHNELRTVVGPPQAQLLTGRDHGRRRAFAPEAIVSQTDLDCSPDRHLDEEEVIERTGPDVDRRADAHQVERDPFEIGAADDPGYRNIGQSAHPMRLQHGAELIVHGLEIVRGELTTGGQRKFDGRHGR